MPELHITVKNKIAEAEPGTPSIVCGNDKYTAVFTFDDEWTAYNIKTMRVAWLDTFSGQQRHADVEFAGTTVRLPVIVDAYEVMLGAYAGDALATTPVRIPCERSITDGATYHDEPTADVYEQLLAYLETRKETGIIMGATAAPITGIAEYTIGIAEEQ